MGKPEPITSWKSQNLGIFIKCDRENQKKSPSGFQGVKIGAYYFTRNHGLVWWLMLMIQLYPTVEMPG